MGTGQVRGELKSVRLSYEDMKVLGVYGVSNVVVDIASLVWPE